MSRSRRQTGGSRVMFGIRRAGREGWYVTKRPVRAAHWSSRYILGSPAKAQRVADDLVEAEKDELSSVP
jgi:hypothetical protein